MAPYQQISGEGIWQRCSRKMASTVKKSFCVLRYELQQSRNRFKVNISESRNFET
jgi:hypothetical protein